MIDASVSKLREQITQLASANCSWVHGCYRTPEYRAYISTKSRCMNPKNPEWQYYGARGIDIRFRSFVEFRDHLGPGRP
jgi:hypothetical protein